MKKWLILALLAPALATAQRYETSDGKIRGNCLPLWVDQGDGGVVGSTKD